MKKGTLTQQLSLPLEFSSSQLLVCAREEAASFKVGGVTCSPELRRIEGTVSRLIDFQAAFSQRETSNRASLYRQILRTVRHIGE